MFVRVVLCVAVLSVAWGCDSSAPAPAKSRVQLGGGESAPPPPPAAAGSVAARPQASAPSESSAPAAAPSTAAASPPPAPAEPVIDAEQQALLDQADPKNWRKDYYAFLKNVQVVDGKISWGEMKEFERWFHLLHETTDAMYDGIKERNSGNKGKQAANKYLQLREQTVKAAKYVDQSVWKGRVVSKASSGGQAAQLDLPPLPAPAVLGFYVPKEEFDQWESVQVGDTVRFRCQFHVAGGVDPPMIIVYMHLLP